MLRRNVQAFFQTIQGKQTVLPRDSIHTEITFNERQQGFSWPFFFFFAFHPIIVLKKRRGEGKKTNAVFFRGAQEKNCKTAARLGFVCLCFVTESVREEQAGIFPCPWGTFYVHERGVLSV